MKITKEKLMELVGKKVKITLFDGSEASGVLGYSMPGRKPGRFCVGNYDFRVSHVKKCTVEQRCEGNCPACVHKKCRR